MHVYSKILTEMVSRRPAGDTRDVSILYGPGHSGASLDVRHTVTTWDCGSYTSSRCNNNIDTETASERRGGLNASSNFSAGNISRNRSRAKFDDIAREKRGDDGVKSRYECRKIFSASSAHERYAEIPNVNSALRSYNRIGSNGFRR
ncbi:unnamed protein product [Lasius platythorax]|uniref:Uncharacterized protein n=1 Tax=Lasius platythorax TaxID=488582 RepID=A0AAV2N5E8_9HYME